MGSSLTANLFVFILAAFLGYEVVRRVSPQLHTPLMSLTNAISAISVVGAITIAGSHHDGVVLVSLGAIAVACAMINVEVRTRSSDDNGPPEKTVDHRKQRFLLRSARWYMARRRLMHLNARFDLAAVIWPPQAKPVIRYHRSYFSG